MKTTIDLPNDLLDRSKAVARRENTTLAALIEEGLHLALRARTRKRATPFVVQPFQGDGLTFEFASASLHKVLHESSSAVGTVGGGGQGTRRGHP